MATSSNKRMFPCPVCTGPREVRLTKKGKPYIVCDPCGIQMFVRGPDGIAEFDRLVDQSDREDLWTRLKEMHRRYRLKCHKCGSRFWIEPELIKTSLIDGSLKGFRCPQNNCAAIVAWERQQ
jgi:transcription elongation factor Elf1